ncbi:cell division protein PerM [Corynebacterium marquesiae]|uniref:cell division protein PerM n=1 Tax=Corynebacterium marquesiae TaxID=2913503 RepID=UPI0032ECC5EA
MAKWTPMNKNTSPQSRSTPRPRSQARGRTVRAQRTPRAPHPSGSRQSSGSAQRVARKAGSKAKVRRTPAPLTKAGRIRRMLITAAVPNVVIVLIIMAIALGGLMLTGSPMAWWYTIVAETWMVFNLAPVSAADVHISFLPALPALILAAVVAVRVRSAVKHKVSVKDLLTLLACVLGVPVVFTIIAWLMLWDAGKVYDVSPPNLAQALLRVIVLHLAAMAAGMGWRLWRALAKRYGVPRPLVDATQNALRYLAYLAIGAAAVFAVVFLVNVSRQGEMMNDYPTISGLGIAGLVLLSVLYIPNAIVSTAAVLVGSEFSVGEGSVSLFSAHLVPLPPLPITGGIPASAPSWAVALLIVPLGAAIYSLYKKRPSFQDVLVATVASAVIMLVACYLVSGDLGYYGSTGPQLWTAAGLTALWMAVVGCAVAAGFAFVAWRAARTAPGAAPTDEYADEPAAAADEAPTEPEREPITDPEIVDAEVVEDEPEDTAPDAAAEEPEEEQKEEGAPADEVAERPEEAKEGDERGVAKPLSQQLKDQMGESEQYSSSEDSPEEGERG